jgi:hypothetical protein
MNPVGGLSVCRRHARPLHEADSFLARVGVCVSDVAKPNPLAG